MAEQFKTALPIRKLTMDAEKVLQVINSLGMGVKIHL